MEVHVHLYASLREELSYAKYIFMLYNKILKWIFFRRAVC